MHVNLSILAIILGVGMAVVPAYALVKPAAFGVALRKFPRSLPWGVVLMLLATGWFLYYLNQESVSDFAAYKPIMLAGFGAVGVAACFFLQDYLAVRGLSVVLLLLAKLIVDNARWMETEWRLVMIVWAYSLVLTGMWFTIYPWHLRDWIKWETATEQRIRMTSLARLAFGILVLVLGCTVFKGS